MRRVAARTASTVPELQLLNPNERWFSPTGRLVPTTCGDDGRSSVCSTATKRLATLIEGTTITANFRQGGQLQGNAGRNDFLGSYEAQGNTISIGDAASTQKEWVEP